MNKEFRLTITLKEAKAFSKKQKQPFYVLSFRIKGFEEVVDVFTVKSEWEATSLDGKNSHISRGISVLTEMYEKSKALKLKK